MYKRQSPWYEQIYIVLGDNGKTYEATYGSANSLIGNVYILTVDVYKRQGNDTYNIKAYNTIRDINKYIKISDNIDVT